MKWHHGELAVQARAGTGDRAQHSGPGVRAGIPRVAAEFLSRRRMVVIGAADPEGRMWASPLIGPAGFLWAEGAGAVMIGARPGEDDPLRDAFRHPAKVGMIAVEHERRRRMRVNGTARSVPGGLRVQADQVYANCPKYIQARHPLEPAVKNCGGGSAARGRVLGEEQARAIGGADTFFVATADERGNADASHRGGNPGFVRVVAPDRLVWPDYAGNGVFMTLGNLEVNPAAGLLFPDFSTGAALHLSGTARVDWNPGRAAAVPGAERLVEFTITDVVEVPDAAPLRWSGPEYSRFNPPTTPPGSGAGPRG